MKSKYEERGAWWPLAGQGDTFGLGLIAGSENQREPIEILGTVKGVCLTACETDR
jgi:hypothetical protein